MEAGHTISKGLRWSKTSCQESGNGLNTLVMRENNQVKVKNIQQQTFRTVIWQRLLKETGN